MSGNRVDELEASVSHLRATVDGLLDELMETKQRLRAVEQEVDPDLELPRTERTNAESILDGASLDIDQDEESDEPATERSSEDGDQDEIIIA
jgi:hypothetical protein